MPKSFIVRGRLEAAKWGSKLDQGSETCGRGRNDRYNKKNKLKAVFVYPLHKDFRLTDLLLFVLKLGARR